MAFTPDRASKIAAAASEIGAAAAFSAYAKARKPDQNGRFQRKEIALAAAKKARDSALLATKRSILTGATDRANWKNETKKQRCPVLGPARAVVLPDTPETRAAAGCVARYDRPDSPHAAERLAAAERCEARLARRMRIAADHESNRSRKKGRQRKRRLLKLL